MRPPYPLLGSLSEDVFERRKSNRSGLFAFLGSNFAYLGGIFPVGMCRPVLQILTLFLHFVVLKVLQNVFFPHPFF